MTHKCVPDELLGMISVRLLELFRRVKEGTIPCDRVADDLQALAEGATFQRHFIDCDSSPFTPEGWKVESHKKMGLLLLDFSKVRFYIFNSKSIQGHELRGELEKEPVLNANVLDYLLAHTKLIPDEWKGKPVFFWGTIYRDLNNDLYVRFLFWDFVWLGWVWHSRCLDRHWDFENPAVCQVE